MLSLFMPAFSQNPHISYDFNDYIKKKRLEIIKKKKNIETLKKHVENLQERAKSFVLRTQIHAKRKLENQIKETLHKIECIENDQSLYEFETKVEPFMLMYKWYMERVSSNNGVLFKNKVYSQKPLPSRKYRKLQNKKSSCASVNSIFEIQESNSMDIHDTNNELLRKMDLDNEQKANLIFMQAVAEIEGHSKPLITIDHDMCEICKVPMVYNPVSSKLVCQNCFREIDDVEATITSIGYNDQTEKSTYTYQRMNHFNNWLSKLFDNYNITIPQEVVKTVVKHYYMNCKRIGVMNREHIINRIKEITEEEVLHILKSLTKAGFTQYKQYTIHSSKIVAMITGKEIHLVTVEQKEELRNMFMRCQEPYFKKYSLGVRHNFLHYGYTLYKFCQIKGWNHLLPMFPLLKGFDKIDQHETIFKQLCADLNWPFIPISRKQQQKKIVTCMNRFFEG